VKYCSIFGIIKAIYSQQISNIADESYRAKGTDAKTPVNKVEQFSYDANGNLLSITTGTKSGAKLSTTNSRKMLWDEENRLLAVSDNGFVSNYWYDASGERTVKESGDNEGVTVNGLQSAGRSGTTNFTAYISPYLVVSNGGNYTKHIYMGGQRITSKVSNSGIFTASPVTTIDLQAKYTAQTAKIKERFDSLRVTYKGTPQSGGLVSKDTSTPTGSYFYHSDHLGSSSLITDASGAIVQHLEYVPFGETFIDERRSTSSWTTPYLFSGKERDEETGLLYFGARYQDSKYGIWYSVDPLAEKFPNVSSYVYCHDNPINMIDPDGRWDVKVSASSDRGRHPYAVYVVTDRTGNVIYKTVVRVKGTGGRDRGVTNSDTPQGRYKITGWRTPGDKNHSTESYGKEDFLDLYYLGGEGKKRQGFQTHGGRKQSPELSDTHGCPRMADADIKELKEITTNLELNDINEKKGYLSLTNDLSKPVSFSDRSEIKNQKEEYEGGQLKEVTVYSQGTTYLKGKVIGIKVDNKN